MHAIRLCCLAIMISAFVVPRPVAAADASAFSGCWERKTEDEHYGVFIYPENMETRSATLKSDERRYLISQDYFDSMNVDGDVLEFIREDTSRLLRLKEDDTLERSYPHLPNQRPVSLTRCTPETVRLFATFSPDFSDLGGQWGALEEFENTPVGAELLIVNLENGTVLFRSPDLVRVHGDAPMHISSLLDVHYDTPYKAMTFRSEKSGESFWLAREEAQELELGRGRILRKSPIAWSERMTAMPWKPEAPAYDPSFPASDFSRLLVRAASRIRGFKNNQKPSIAEWKDAFMTVSVPAPVTFSLGPVDNEENSSRVQLRYTVGNDTDDTVLLHAIMRVLELTQPGLTRRYEKLAPGMCKQKEESVNVGGWKYSCTSEIKKGDNAGETLTVVFTAEPLMK